MTPDTLIMFLLPGFPLEPLEKVGNGEIGTITVYLSFQ